MPVCDALIKNVHIINGSGIEPWVATLPSITGIFARLDSRYNPEYSSFTVRRRSAV